MRQAGRIVSVAVTIAVGVNSDGRREVLDDWIRMIHTRSNPLNAGTEHLDWQSHATK
ncbi:transposase [Sphingomonas sp. So64.6b]|uniref:transposase n=1 Tax=Sphingomonas sp. So64.6b TaxID=2997354 RepID=UPI00225E3D34|nr:transposase [Sphingomonas sp. So64.6b]